MTPATVTTIREKLRLTQTQLAFLLCVTKAAVCHWEAGRRTCTQMDTVLLETFWRAAHVREDIGRRAWNEARTRGHASALHLLFRTAHPRKVLRCPDLA